MRTLINLIVAVCFFSFTSLYGQEYKHDVKNAKKIEISQLTGKIKIIGQSGPGLVVQAEDLEEIPDRAKGLKPLSGGGVDNTNLGLNISEAGGVISIKGTTKQSSDADYTFLVPNTIAVSVDYSSPFTSNDVEVENFRGEFEMNGMNDGAILKDITGPVYLDLINGDIEIIFTSVNQSSPMSIKTINGDVDVAIPSGTKASFELSSLHGDIYSDLDIKVEREKDKDDITFFGGKSDVEGTLNGGGVKMTVSSINGNIYLRKK